MTQIVLDLPENERASLLSIAEYRGLSLAALLLQTARALYSEDEEFRRAVEEGVAEADAGLLMDHADVVAEARARRR